ncbi:MAG: hypothetical protein IKQ60_07065 [Candidatus Methanomethylophilaceae archaeon]|nr:hypothetical protein [Candidatus Methanomethylophilaceae archaeon]
MGLLENIKNVVSDVSKTAQTETKEVDVVFDRIPETLEDFTSLPQAELSTPFDTAALTVLALCVYPKDKDLCFAMLDFLRGESRPMNNVEKHLIADHFQAQSYVPRSYFDGATPVNGYTPEEPYTVRVSDDQLSYVTKGHATLNLKSGGAESPRKINLRKGEDDKWYLWEQFLLVGIEEPPEKKPIIERIGS